MNTKDAEQVLDSVSKELLLSKQAGKNLSTETVSKKPIIFRRAFFFLFGLISYLIYSSL